MNLDVSYHKAVYPLFKHPKLNFYSFKKKRIADIQPHRVDAAQFGPAPRRKQ
jgi:hypothetical protein